MSRRPKGPNKSGPPKRDGLPGRDEILEFIKTSPTKAAGAKAPAKKSAGT